MNSPRFKFIARIVCCFIMCLSVNTFGDSIKPKDSADSHQIKRPSMTVRAVRTKRQLIQAWLYGQGTARSISREYLLFETDGKVEWIKKGPDGNELREGDAVYGPKNGEDEGELIARLDDRQQLAQLRITQDQVKEARKQLEVAKANLMKAQAEARLSDKDLERRQELAKMQTVAQSELEKFEAKADVSKANVIAAEANVDAAEIKIQSSEAQVAKAELELEHTRIYAPNDGIIAYLNIKQGMYLGSGSINTSSEDSLLQSVPIVLIDPKQFEVRIELPVFQGKFITVGQPAYLTTDSGDSTAKEIDIVAQAHAIGKVFSVTPSVTPGGRAMLIKVRTETGADRILDGLFVSCWIEVARDPNAVVLPFNALIHRAQQTYVYVVDPKTNRVAQRSIQTGIWGLASVQVMKGVKEGEIVVTEGRRDLTDDAQVTLLLADEREK